MCYDPRLMNGSGRGKGLVKQRGRVGGGGEPERFELVQMRYEGGAAEVDEGVWRARGERGGGGGGGSGREWAAFRES